VDPGLDLEVLNFKYHSHVGIQTPDRPKGNLLIKLTTTWDTED